MKKWSLIFHLIQLLFYLLKFDLDGVIIQSVLQVGKN